MTQRKTEEVQSSREKKSAVNCKKQLFENRMGRQRSQGFDPFLSAKEAADYLGVSARFIYERLANHEIRSQPLGRLRRIRLSTLENWLIRQQNGEGL